MPELLHEEVLSRRGPIERVRRYWRGAHPELGALHAGLTGRETLEERDRVRPTHTVRVEAAGAP